MKLKAAQIIEIVNQHSQKFYDLGARKLGLFGSYARNEATPESDMDFLVVLAEPDFFDFMNIKLYLENLFGCEIDLGEEDAIREELRPYIMQDVIYAEGIEILSERHFASHPEN